MHADNVMLLCGCGGHLAKCPFRHSGFEGVFKFRGFCLILMNFKFMAGLAGLAMSAALASPSQAADINFEPEGGQLDGDAILDILLEPGQPITFTNTFENAADFFNFGMAQIPRPTLFIEYLVTFDSQELQYTGAELDFNNFISNTCLVPGGCGSSIVVGNGQLTITHQTAFTNPLDPPNQFPLDRISFIGTNVNGVGGDGLSDYSLAGSNSGSGIFGVQISSFTSSTVEVQRVPGPVPLLGLGAAFGASRRLRRRLNSTQVSSSN